MKKIDFLKYWNAFLHWRFWRDCAEWFGWRVCGSFFAKVWRAVYNWTGWKRLFRISPLVLLLLSGFCVVGLLYVFVQRMENSVIAYPLYVLSAYTLTAVAASVPGWIRRLLEWIERHPGVKKALGDEELKFALGLYFEQFINFVYGIFKIVSGVIYGSAWIGADGIYNFSQALIQLFQILRRRREMTMVKQWKSYRICGFLILFLHLTMTGLVFQMVNWGRAEDYPGYMIFATAAFAFYKIINSFVDVAKDRRHAHPVDSSVRMLDLSQAFFSMFSLQVSLLHVYGSGEPWELWMNGLTGCVVCLLVVAMGFYMILRANREIKKVSGVAYE